MNDPITVVEKVTALSALSPESRRLLATGASGSYARLGQNDDQGHAAGLSKWTLVCPKFHQYPFDAEQTLNKVLACASSAPTLIVAESLAKQEAWPNWNNFVDQVEGVLTSSYECDAGAGLRICRRLKESRR